MPGSAALAANLAGSSENQAARSIAIAKSVAALAVMELLAHLAGAAAALIGLAMRKRETAVAGSAKKSPAVAKVMQQAVATPAKRGTAAYYLQRLHRDFPEIAAKVDSGRLSVYAGCIEAGIRKRPAKRKWDANDYVKAPALASA
jgi:hypothetical protein